MVFLKKKPFKFNNNKVDLIFEKILKIDAKIWKWSSLMISSDAIVQALFSGPLLSRPLPSADINFHWPSSPSKNHLYSEMKQVQKI